jgi:hypothetical protein
MLEMVSVVSAGDTHIIISLCYVKAAIYPNFLREKKKKKKKKKKKY